MTAVGDTIVTARRAAGMTQEQLRTELGVTQAALSRWESNLREPDRAMLERLADALGVTSAFLDHRFRCQSAVAVDAHMRRRRSAKASDWKRLEARLNLLRMHASYLLERMPLEAQAQVPAFDHAETTPEDAALLVRAQWRMPIGPARELTRRLEAAGILIWEEDFGTARVDGLSQWAGEHPVILVNARLPTDRKRLTLAHELGHLALHTKYPDTVDVEPEADRFAAQFLMPDHVISPALRNLTIGKLVELKREWGVSMQAIYERAWHLQRVSAQERQRFYRTMGARGYRTREPGSAELPPERPALAAALGSQLLGAGLSAAEVAGLAGVHPRMTAHPFAPGPRSLRVV